MLKSVIGFIRHKDSSRSSSPARSPKALQSSDSAAPAVLQGTDTTSSSHAAATKTAAATTSSPKQLQQLSGGAAADTPAVATNGTSAAAAAATPAAAATTDTTAAAAAAVESLKLKQQQQQPDAAAELAVGVNGTGDHAGNDSPAAAAAANGTASRSRSVTAAEVPPVPPLAPGTVTRTSSAGSSGNTSRRASLLSDAGRASSRTSLPHQQLEVTFQLDEQQPSTAASSTATTTQQQQQHGRPAGVSQLPLHLVPGGAGSASTTSTATTTTPPSVATQQTVSPEPSIQFQQQSAQAQSHASSSNSSTAWSFGTHSEQNKREHMEDRFVATDLTGTPAFSTAQRAGFFAVYDGHSGHEAAEYLEAHLQSYVLAAGADALAADPCKVLSAAVQQVESEIVSSFAAGGGPETAGSTLCAMLLVDNNLYVANVGDSRAVLAKGTEIKQLTRDHKPGCSIEAARICLDDPNADISGDGYMYGEIAVARAIGSAAWKRDPTRRALIPTPETGSFDVTDQDFVLLATDGLWDKVDNTQAVAAARRSLARSRNAETLARDLVERAQRLESTDNITVVALLLHGRAISMPKSNSMLFKRSAALSSAIAAATAGGADSPPGGSTPCSGASTPASGATPRSCTPSRGHSLISISSAPAAAVAAAAAAAAAAGERGNGGSAGGVGTAAAAMSPQRSLPPPQPSRRQD